MEMINNVVNFPQVPEVAQIRPVPDAPKEVQASDPSNATKDSPDSDLNGGGKDQGPPPEYALRLTMDKDPRTGDWVYKAIDRYTGKVVRQLPRQELLDMKRAGNYQAGTVIKTEV